MSAFVGPQDWTRPYFLVGPKFRIINAPDRDTPKEVYVITVYSKN